MNTWFYSDTQHTYGPITTEQLIAMIQAGQLVAGHFIMANGAQEWQALGTSPFSGYLPQAAPAVAAPAARPGPPVQRPAQPRPAAARSAPVPVKKKSPLLAIAAVLALAALGGGYFWRQRTAPTFPTATREQPTAWNNCGTASQRLETLRRTGGSPEVEAAVSAAFEYLKDKQNPDGSWGTHHRVGNTALALLAYAGRCETADSSFYGDTITRGIMFLIETGKQNSQGAFLIEGENSHADLIHGTATEALGQMYLAARYGFKTVPGIREAFEKGVGHIIKSNPLMTDRAKSHVFALAWQCEALNTAKLTDFKFAGLDDCISRTVSALRTLQNSDGGFEAQSPEKPQNITGACLRVLQLFPDGNGMQVENGIRFARQHFQNEPLERAYLPFLDVVFYTRAFRRQGGDDWRFWNFQMLPALLARCNPDGSFSSSSSSRKKGADFDITALGTLILETYYQTTP
jgi:hypothetical protein